MDDRWLVHNLHWDGGAVELRARDPQFRRLQRQPLVHRPALLDRLPRGAPGIYTLGGGRQVGKTTLLKQLIESLLIDDGVAPERVAYVTGELFRDADDLRRTIGDLVEQAERAGRDGSPGLAYILVDEVTWVEGWDRAVKFLADSGALDQVFLLLTGSDLVLIQDAMRRLPGRRGRADEVDFHLRPLSFLEHCELRGAVPRDDLAQLAAGAPGDDLPDVDTASLGLLEQEAALYHQTGGYLTAINDVAGGGEVAPATLRTYSDWVRGDVLKLRRQESFLREVLEAITRRYGSQISWNALARELPIDHPQTVAEYCLLLERMDAAIIVSAVREDRLGPAPKKAKKLYFADPFIHRSIRRYLGLEDLHADPHGALALELEASVLGHLRRAFPTYYVKARGEIDAAYVAGGRLWPIEVKWTRSLRPADLDTIARYPGGLVAGRVRNRRLVAGVPVLPAPVVLLRIARMVGAGGR